MVKKPFLSTRRKIILVLIILCTGIVAYPVLKSGFNTHHTPWRLDSEYSEKLTILAGMNGPLIAKTVDAIRIYRTFQKHDDMFGLDDLFEKNLVFESKDKQFAERIVIAAQQTIMHLDCKRNTAGEHFHVILLDNKQMRAGYFLLIRCEGGQYAIIYSLQKGGGSSIYYNSSLLQLLNKELPPLEERNSANSN